MLPCKIKYVLDCYTVCACKTFCLQYGEGFNQWLCLASPQSTLSGHKGHRNTVVLRGPIPLPFLLFLLLLILVHGSTRSNLCWGTTVMASAEKRTQPWWISIPSATGSCMVFLLSVSTFGMFLTLPLWGTYIY